MGISKSRKYWFIGFNIVSNITFPVLFIIGVVALIFPEWLKMAFQIDFDKFQNVIITIIGLVGTTMVIGFWYLIKATEDNGGTLLNINTTSTGNTATLTTIHDWIKKNDDNMHILHNKSKSDMYANFLSELKQITGTPEVYVTHFEKLGELQYDDGDSEVEIELMKNWTEKINNGTFKEVRQIVHLSSKNDYLDNYKRLNDFKSCTNFKLNVMIGLPLEPFLDVVIVRDNFLLMDFSKDSKLPFDTDFGFIIKNKDVINDFIQYFNIWWDRSISIKDRNQIKWAALKNIFRKLPDDYYVDTNQQLKSNLLGMTRDIEILTSLNSLLDKLTFCNANIYKEKIIKLIKDTVAKIDKITAESIKIQEADYKITSEYIYNNAIDKIIAVSNESESTNHFFDNWNSVLGKEIIDLNDWALNRGVAIERIFILTNEQLSNDEINTMLQEQKSMGITVHTILSSDVDISEDFIISDNNLLMYLSNSTTTDCLATLTRETTKINEYQNKYQKLMYDIKKIIMNSLEFVRFWSEDELELQGLYYKSAQKSDWAIIHIHGLAGNFYENPFVDVMSKTYTELGYNFLVFNNRGHDYITDVYSKNGGSIGGGSAYERFDDCVLDIESSIKFLKERGVNNFILQGHSSGSNKVAYYMYEKKSAEIKSIILLSPCDDTELQIDEKGIEQHNLLLSDASKLIEQGNPDTLMPEGSFYSYLMSAKTYYNYFKEDSKHDIFHYRNLDKPFKELNSFSIPVFIRFGTDGEYLLSSDIAIECLNKEIHSIKNIGFIKGASHNYRGFEKELVEQIKDWLLKIKTK